MLIASLPVVAGSDLTAIRESNAGTQTLDRMVIAAGSGTSTGGDFSISGTVGQSDVDPLQPSTGGAFAITGGFWFAASPQPDGLFDDGFEGL